MHACIRRCITCDIHRSHTNRHTPVLARTVFRIPGCVLGLVSTVVSVAEDGFLDHSLDRTKYRGSQTPQAFRFGVIFGAYAKCTEYDFEHGTECLHLALTYVNPTISTVAMGMRMSAWCGSVVVSVGQYSMQPVCSVQHAIYLAVLHHLHVGMIHG